MWWNRFRKNDRIRYVGNLVLWMVVLCSKIMLGETYRSWSFSHVWLGNLDKNWKRSPTSGIHGTSTTNVVYTWTALGLSKQNLTLPWKKDRCSSLLKWCLFRAGMAGIWLCSFRKMGTTFNVSSINSRAAQSKALSNFFAPPPKSENLWESL